MRKLVRAGLTWRGLPFALAAVVVALSLPSLKRGFRGDDVMQRVWLLGEDRFPQLDPAVLRTDSIASLNTSFEPATNGHLTDLGVLPWWTPADLRVVCLRPLAGLTQRLDYLLWPDSAPLMLAHNLGWAALSILAAAALYRRRLASPAVAGLAAVLFALDAAHGPSSFVMAYRNGLLALFFAILSVLAHVRRREEGWKPGALLSPLFLAASLLSAEVGMATMAYLVAHAVCLEPGSVRERVRGLLPCFAVALVWQVAYTATGHGVQASGIYMNPPSEPVRFLGALTERVPAYLLGQWVDLDLMQALVGSGRRLWVLGLASTLVVGIVLFPLLRKDATARFWALGLLLCLVPASALLPEGRRLLFASIGGAGLVAQVLAEIFRPNQGASLGRWGATLVGIGLVSSRLVLSPLALRAKALPPDKTDWVEMSLDRGVESQTLVVLNPPSALYLMMLPHFRALRGEPQPLRVRALAASGSSGTATRIDDRTLAVRVKGGYLDGIHDTVFRDPRRTMEPGERVALTGLVAEVAAVKEDGRPWEVRFRFDVPLEDASLRWLQWRDGVYVPLPLPKIGEAVDFSPAGVRP